ncbi:hypothetical protein AALP_AAs69785U000100 [Arabis alpina]|uniref:Uncharacterized protein n=1 Tax=Arabis alpina TaxID=50452 RepID=A0A087G098_ARAAL|nr:hypothetical protein AALP_AAs69785U000100 [Arabis alpina]
MGSLMAYDLRSSIRLTEPMSARANASAIRLGSDVDPKPSSTEDMVYPVVLDSRRADTFASLGDSMRNTVMDGDPMRLIHRRDDNPIPSWLHTDDPMGMIRRGVASTGMISLNDEDHELPSGNAFASSSSSSSGSRASSDEDTVDEVQQTKKAKKAKKKARTVEADCIDLVKTRWERRVKPSLPEVSKEFITAMHTELSSGNGNWRKSFSRRSIERALSAEIFPRKILGRGQARMSFREQAALEAATKAKGSSNTSTPRVVAPMASTPTASSVRARSSRPLAPKTFLPPPSSGELAEYRRLSAERARILSGKGKGVDRETPSERQRVDTYPAIVVGRETLASHVGGLLSDKAYSAVKSRASEFSLFFDRLVGEYDEDVLCRDNDLGATKEVNAVLQSRLEKIAERNEVLERDALSMQKVKKDYDDKLTKLKLRCTKTEGEARDEMARGFAERTSEVAGLLAEIGGKLQNDMLNLAEIDANLEFIGLLQGSAPPDLPTEVKALRERRHPIYDAHDVFADLLASVRRVLETPEVFARAVEASVAVDDDVEVTDEDVVEVTDDDEDAED